MRASRIRAMAQAMGLALTPQAGGVECAGKATPRYVVPIDGITISVIVPNAALGLPERPISCRTCLLLIEGRPEAILVDSVSRFEDVIPACIRPPSRLRLGQKWRTVLDPDQFRAIAA